MDDGMRALERRFRESGLAEDHARWLQARVRAGELTPEDAVEELASAAARYLVDAVEREVAPDLRRSAPAKALREGESRVRSHGLLRIVERLVGAAPTTSTTIGPRVTLAPCSWRPRARAHRAPREVTPGAMPCTPRWPA